MNEGLLHFNDKTLDFSPGGNLATSVDAPKRGHIIVGWKDTQDDITSQ